MANAPDPEPETSDDSDASYDSHHMQCPRCGVTESSDHFEYIPYYIDHPNAVFPNDNLENDRDFCTHCATIVENTLGETRNYCEDNPDCVDCAAARAEQEQAVAAEAALLNGGSVTHFCSSSTHLGVLQLHLWTRLILELDSRHSWSDKTAFILV